MKRMPFPTNENVGQETSAKSATTPWKRANPNEPPLFMFQVQLVDGSMISYAYSDLRETRLRDAGYLQLRIFGMEKTHVTIQGRHLTELANLIGMGRIKTLVELGPRTFDRPEASPSIDSITIERMAD